MKRLLVCLLLVGVVGCGSEHQKALEENTKARNDQTEAIKAKNEQQQSEEQPSGETEKDAAPRNTRNAANLTACPDCGKEVSKRATACPHCDVPLSDTLVLSPTVDKTTVNSIGMKLTLIPAGEFQMGSPDAEPDRVDNETRHLVKISKPFYLAVHEVTQQQYEKIMGARPWHGEKFVKEGADYPATYVSHDDAVEFCRRLSRQEGVDYRLPTEAEWEYACRAGTSTAYSFGDDAAKLGQYAWCKKNTWDIGEQYAHRVGQKLPNPWGLYDMHGNVWEWSQDWYAPYESEKVVSDPMGPAQGEERVLRGGSFVVQASLFLSAYRLNVQPDFRYIHLGFGFRAARTYNLSP